MTSPIFIDANVPIYAGGRDHPLRESSLMVLGLVGDHPREFWTNAEVLQELLHRYRASGRWEQGRAVFEGFVELMRGRIEPVIDHDIESAAELASRLPRLDTRDLVHLGVMARVGADTIVSADRGFDHATGIHRLDPGDVSTWRNQVDR